ncbi:hypothetical protein BD626DRAFT_543990 [Schizophyllum amplum]|uniref:Reverse transcriptase domain-containing protein n=1 Tax=Schizophyllum amplum TaxID=97359 RepID=A0A550CWH9_9AGAR|nr:hypothetical protein BD626DRAFT_543990 [Auriculariopsis ampla]
MIRKSEIQGFEIPGQLERLKVRLFADDTSVFLSEFDDYADLETILNTWCKAAKAAFNIKKTEIIPVGSVAFREDFVNEYKEHGKWGNYPQNVRVADEGSAVRILGGFFGNGIDDCDIWAPTIGKVASALDRWGRGHTTFEAKRHAAQFTSAGMTQFLAEVQGMPDRVVQRLNALTRRFFWKGNDHPTVSMDQLYQPLAKGVPVRTKTNMGLLCRRPFRALHARLDEAPR